MMCAWKELVSILPPWIRSDADRLGKTALQELRLRAGSPPVLVLGSGRIQLSGKVSQDDLHYVVNAASRYSPWTAASAANGYLTAPGGHRIGLCGEAVIKDGEMTGIRTLRSLNIRVARDFPGIAEPLAALQGNVLLLGPPGSGKTTLLRDLVRIRSRKENVAVVDERGEVFPTGLETGLGTDILTGCSKAHGVDTVLRTMGPDTIAVDEITAAADCDAVLQAGWCGVRLIATAHAANQGDLLRRQVYQPLAQNKLFDTVVILHADKSFRTERMVL